MTLAPFVFVNRKTFRKKKFVFRSKRTEILENTIINKKGKLLIMDVKKLVLQEQGKTLE